MNKDSQLITDWENEQNYGRQTGPPVCRDQEIQKMTKYRKSGGLPALRRDVKSKRTLVTGSGATINYR